ncbi:hypothetical protein BD626DRAFT_483973 [Schizophyllum amplum]|uniref:NAD(P)-binding protein n=1 Tax=Schizophyllum amplum TaxID=97359 RepID=A0A550CPZ2_9AGAR|nr:hypothetical protein BD626DRAFT_483973 [Auriculariopsis ampla]
MPSLTTVQEFNASVSSASKCPVGVFVGGTSGIGRGMARAFARHHKGNARLIIIARNKVAADELIASLPSPAKDLSEFVYCEASLMRNIDAACAQLAERDVDKINYLVLSVGEFVAYKRELTEEGLDRNLAPAFFGRFRWTQNLAPMLDRAAESGEEAKVMTVALGGKGGTIDWDDLDMTSNMLSRMSSELPTYMDLSFRALAKRHPRVAFTHSNPGAVRSPLFTRSPSWILRIMGYIRAPLIYMTSISEDQSGEYMMYSMYRSQAGFVCVGQRGDVVQGPQYNDEEIDRMWDYVYNRPSVPYPQ